MANTVNIRTGTYQSGDGITFIVADSDLGPCGITDCTAPAMIAIDLGGQGGIRCPEHYQPWAENPAETSE